MRKEYRSVGIIIVAKDTNNFLMLHRVKHPISWSGLAGGMENNETTTQTIKREIQEEIGINPNIVKNIQEVGVSQKMGHIHHVMLGFVDNEFKVPNLQIEENDDYGWFNEKNLPKPLHPGFLQSLDIVKPYLNLRESILKYLKLLNE